MNAVFTHRVLSVVLAFACVWAPATYAEQPLAGGSIARAAAEKGDGAKRFVGERFVRTELFFGTARSDDPPVSEAEFQNFLDTKITPAFPDGLTLLTGLGQFRGSNGLPVEEDSFLLILLYPVEARRESSEKIEQIRTDYKDAFQQESVLRADHCCEWAGF